MSDDDTHTDGAPFGYHGARRRAERLAKDPEATARLLERAGEKAGRYAKRGRLAQLVTDLQTLFRLVRAWFRRQYRQAPWKAIVAALAAIVYFVNPFDLIPDFIPFFGVLDDAAVVAWVIRSIAKELERFREWERTGDTGRVNGHG